jgi:archaemetzincin
MGLRDKTLGVIDLDLYVPGLNFVFGEADPGSGVCVISLTRLRQEFYGRAPDEELFLKRAVKEAVHELGHLYGLPHCTDRRCVMYFSNSLPDTDKKTRRFCERCKKAVTGK